MQFRYEKNTNKLNKYLLTNTATDTRVHNLDFKVVFIMSESFGANIQSDTTVIGTIVAVTMPFSTFVYKRERYSSKGEIQADLAVISTVVAVIWL